MADMQQLEDQIVRLSLLEASALVKKLEERLGVSRQRLHRLQRLAEREQQQRLLSKRRPSSP